MNANFHISLPCKNIVETINFYSNNLGLNIGRNKNNWVDINLFGNQITFVLAEKFHFDFPFYLLEKEQLPSFHFGIILNDQQWNSIYEKINQWSDTVIKKTFFENKNGEQSSFFIKDPNGYHIEFKTFTKGNEIFI